MATDFALGVESLLVAITMVGVPSLDGKLPVSDGFAAELAPEALGMPILPQAAQETTIAKRLLTACTPFRRARPTRTPTNIVQIRIQQVPICIESCMVQVIVLNLNHSETLSCHPLHNLASHPFLQSLSTLNSTMFPKEFTIFLFSKCDILHSQVQYRSRLRFIGIEVS